MNLNCTNQISKNLLRPSWEAVLATFNKKPQEQKLWDLSGVIIWLDKKNWVISQEDDWEKDSTVTPKKLQFDRDQSPLLVKSAIYPLR